MINRKQLIYDIDKAFRDPNKRYALLRMVNQFADEINRLQEKEQSWRTAEFRFGEDDQPVGETPLPPIGMAIEAMSSDIACDWEPADVQEDLHGIPVVRVDGRLHNMREVKWRYKRAPKQWPDWAKVWVGLDTAEYVFLQADEWRVGEQLFEHRGKILYVEHRPNMSDE